MLDAYCNSDCSEKSNEKQWVAAITCNRGGVRRKRIKMKPPSLDGGDSHIFGSATDFNPWDFKNPRVQTRGGEAIICETPPHKCGGFILSPLECEIYL
jgi:hypothetical protein